MNWRRRLLVAAGLSVLLGGLIVLAQPAPQPARANLACDAVGAPIDVPDEIAGWLTGGVIGGGNPVGDACSEVTDGAVEAVTSPITGALKGIGNSIFSQVTTWVADGATWLIGKVVREIETTTTPELTSKGFLAEYAEMAVIASILAAAMLLLAILEAVAQSSWGVLGRAVFVSVPLAFLGTSVAFAVVQLLLVATDGMSHAIAVATQHHSEHFFKGAIKGLGDAGGAYGRTVNSGDPATEAVGGASGSVAVPLFVTFLAAIIGAFAAFFVWIELLMRDAAVYVVALFMPMALAASIWPRWSGALRKTGELLVVVIASKFVIVSIIALAAGLAGEEGADTEHILAASALMLLACFAPFVLFKLVPFAEGALGAAYGRRSAAGGSMAGLQMVSEIQIIRNMARSNWGDASPPEVWNVKGDGGGSGSSAGGPGGGGSSPAGGKPAGGGSAGKAASGGEAAAVSPAAAAAEAPAMAAKAAASAAHSAGQRLASSGTAQASEAASTRGANPSGGIDRGEETAPRQASTEPKGGASGSPTPSESPPRPPREVTAKPTPRGAS